MWMFMSGMCGASAVAAGAAGAHMVKASSPEMKAVWQTGSQYHLAHSIMLASMAVGLKAGRKRNVVCGCFALGTLLFSGSCYAVVLKDQRKPYSLPAPVGGGLLIAGWVALGLLP